MAIKKQMCQSHPDRAAIGVCVITNQPICAECSTRYEGVNYSKEGLRILQARRASESARKAGSGRWLLWLAWLTSPGMLYLLYLFYFWTFQALTNLLHRES